MLFGCLLAGCAAQAGPAAPPPNVLLISLDTLRADHLGAFGADRGLTPNLDAFAAQATVFTQAWSQANTTAMSHAALFTGRYPSEVGHPGPKFTLSAGAPTAAEVLTAYGYETAAFTAGLHLAAGWGLNRGFATYRATAPLGSLWHTAPAAADWLDARAATAPPFFLFVHGYDCHAPYYDPPPYGVAWAPKGYRGAAVNAVRRRIGTELVFDGRLFAEDDMLGFLWDLGRPRPRDAAGKALLAASADDHAWEPFEAEDDAYVRGVYDGGVAYADALLGWMMQRLEASGHLDDTVVVVLSDHGEALGEAGRYGHGDALIDAELHVPLMVRVPGGVGRRVEAPVALLDVLPTVLDYAGATPPAGQHGQSLRGWVEAGAGPSREVVYAEGMLRAVSARSSAGRLTFTGVTAGSPWMAPLLASARQDDPAWSVDSTVSAADAPALQAALQAWRASLTVLGAADTPDARLIEEARSHGYFGQ